MAMPQEGYIKFSATWTETEPLPARWWEPLQGARQRLYQTGLIGTYADGIGYGNVSIRHLASPEFVITGSATGTLPTLSGEHYALVTAVDIPQNRLYCTGPIIASSESMSHAVIYQELPWVGGVAHAHHAGLWEQLHDRVPTTPPGVAYGTPAMAESIVRLLRTTNLAESRLFVMAGHEDGLFAFDRRVEGAVELLCSLL